MRFLNELCDRLRASPEVAPVGGWLSYPQDGVGTYRGLNWNNVANGPAHCLLAWAPWAQRRVEKDLPVPRVWIWITDGMGQGEGLNDQQLERVPAIFRGTVVQHPTSMFIPADGDTISWASETVVRIVKRLRQLGK